ncbi:hypothetical protein PMIN04_011947 [Paraphaeosphaeria minitans]
MASIPAGVYGLRVPAGGDPIPASVNPNVAFRITMAAIDPTAEVKDGAARATLKLIRIQDDDEDEDDDDDDFDPDNIEELRAKLLADGVLGSEDESEEEEDDSEEETNGGPSDPAKSKQAKREALQKKLQEEAAAEEMDIDSITNGVNGKGKGKVLDDEDSDESDSEEGDEAEELVLCTLDPEKHWQQTLEITVREGEEIYFSSTGSHDIYLTGNYVAIMDDEDDDDERDLYGLDEDDYDESPDEDELDEDLSELDDEDDSLDDLTDPRITEVDSEEEAPKLVKAEKKGKNKRPAQDEGEGEAMTLDELITKTKAEAPAANGEKPSKKQAKKLKNNEGQAVAAAEPAKEAKKGPTGSPKVVEAKKEPSKGPRNVGGVTVEDKKEGKGKAAKKGDKIEMRYIGKLKNGKQFDANKKGKPFSFKLGVGEVIKGWDVGVAGMQAGAERRLTIPAKLAYGSKALPGIPANSELIFDIKCISVS